MSGVGGVEPETVEMYRARDFPEARWMECAPDTRHTIALYPNEYEVERFVEASALRLVEEELRQERDLRRRAERSRENANRVLRQSEADRDRLAGALRHARGCITEQIGPMPTPSQRLALDTIEAALSPVQGEHEQDGDTK